MADPLDVDPIMFKLIQLIEEKNDAIKQLKGRIDGNCTCM